LGLVSRDFHLPLEPDASAFHQEPDASAFRLMRDFADAIVKISRRALAPGFRALGLVSREFHLPLEPDASAFHQEPDASAFHQEPDASAFRLMEVIPHEH
jgi:hypothetical protein